MSLDLDETVQILTDEAKSIYLRAIRLFEFQICLFFPEALTSEKIHRCHGNARLLAALKFLADFEKAGVRPLSLKKLAVNSNYAEIFDKIILTTGGSKGILGLEQFRQFEKEMRNRRLEAQAVIRFLDFSYRCARLKPETRAKCGVTMARSIVRKAPSYKCNIKSSTLKTRWRQYGRTAGFLYLIGGQKFELFLTPITAPSFTANLLKQAHDIDHIREFFLAYQYLCGVLRPLGYKFPIIRRIEGDRPNLPYARFPDDVQEEIKNYKSPGKSPGAAGR